MHTPSRHNSLSADLGLNRCAPFYRDWQFIGAIVIGLIALLGLRHLLPGPTTPISALDAWLIFNVVLWYPVMEEILFRGLLQGQLLQISWGKTSLLGLSYANWLTTMCFTALHFVHHPPLWALGTCPPSLLFGYFRDRYASIYPAIALHIIFNVEYLLLLA